MRKGIFGGTMKAVLGAIFAISLASPVMAGGGQGPGIVNYKNTPSAAPQQNAATWNYVANSPLLGQTNAIDTNLYVDSTWALDPGYRRTYGAYRYAHTCLATAYAMIEQSIPGGNKGYRIGADVLDANGNVIGNTWDDKIGATGLGLSFTPSADVSFDIAAVSSELKAGNPVILHGNSTSGTGPGGITDHFMVAVGIQPNGDIVANDPFTGRQVTINPSTMRASLTTAKGSTLTYSLNSYRTVR